MFCKYHLVDENRRVLTCKITENQMQTLRASENGNVITAKQEVATQTYILYFCSINVFLVTVSSPKLLEHIHRLLLRVFCDV